LLLDIQLEGIHNHRWTLGSGVLTFALFSELVSQRLSIVTDELVVEFSQIEVFFKDQVKVSDRLSLLDFKSIDNVDLEVILRPHLFYVSLHEVLSELRSNFSCVDPDLLFQFHTIQVFNYRHRFILVVI